MSIIMLALAHALAAHPTRLKLDCHDVCVKYHVERHLEQRYNGEGWVAHERQETVCDEWKSECVE